MATSALLSAGGKNIGVIARPTSPCYLYSWGKTCVLPLCAAVSELRHKKSAPDLKHPFSIHNKTDHPSAIESQKQAIHFVAQQWHDHPNGHHYNLVASDELSSLEQAYFYQFFIPCGNDGLLKNTAPFTLTQVYSAYYMAVAAEQSLVELKDYERVVKEENREKNNPAAG